MSIIDRYNKLNQKFNDLIYRIVGVTDIVLKEQLQEEYKEIEKKIKDIETDIIAEKCNMMIMEYKIFYQQQYVIADNALVALEKTNKKNGLDQLFQKYRLRNPITFKWQLLMHIASALQITIVVKDYENRTLDYISDTHQSSDIKLCDQLLLYIDIYARFSRYVYYKEYKYLIPKHKM